MAPFQVEVSLACRETTATPQGVAPFPHVFHSMIQSRGFILPDTHARAHTYTH